mgnify:FL=1|jgi:hypothetical protein
MSLPEHLLEIRDYAGEGYQPLIDFGAWRVAILRAIDELLPENLDTVQRHDETDEVFVLLAGRCILFLGEGDESVTAIHAVDMEPLKLYNVKRGVWHTHTLSEDATVLIVENVDTTDANSPSKMLSPEQRAEIVRLTQQLW